MSGGFNDPIIGGGGALVYPAIHSPNFSQGPPITGWSIRKDGSAFFSGTIGGLAFEITSAGAFFYSGTPASGNLVASITSAAGTDPFGNHFNAGITSYDNTFGGVTNILGAVIKLFAGVTQRAVLSPGHFTVFNSSGATIYDIDLTKAAQFLYADTGSSTQGALIASEANTAGTDQFGNAYLQGISSLAAGAAEITMLNGTLLLRTLSANASASAAAITVGSTSALQQLALGSGTGPEAGAVPSQLTLTDSGAGKAALTVIDGNDGNVYGTERLIQQVSPRSQSFSAVAAANILGLSVPVAKGTYIVRGSFTIEWNAAAGIPQVVFAGPAVSQYDARFATRQSGSSSTANTNALVAAAAGNGTGYNGTVVNATGTMSGAGVFFDLEISGEFTFTASGTLTLQAASSIANDAWIVVSGFWEVMPK